MIDYRLSRELTQVCAYLLLSLLKRLVTVDVIVIFFLNPHSFLLKSLNYQELNFTLIPKNQSPTDPIMV